MKTAIILTAGLFVAIFALIAIGWKQHQYAVKARQWQNKRNMFL